MWRNDGSAEIGLGGLGEWVYPKDRPRDLFDTSWATALANSCLWQKRTTAKPLAKHIARGIRYRLSLNHKPYRPEIGGVNFQNC